MTATNHAITGALVATVVHQPVLAVPIAFAAHFVMDAIPHFGLPHSTLERNTKKEFRLVLLVDMFLLVILLIALPIFIGSSAHAWWLILLCMLACISPDLIWGYRFYFELKTKTEKAKNLFSRFHKKIQWSETQHGLVTEILWFASVISLVTLRR